MFLYLALNNDYAWLAPYGYSIVLAGFSFYLFRLFEGFYASTFDKPLVRHYWVYKKLTPSQISVLEEEFTFYTLLTNKQKKQFEHRVSNFITEKKFVAREQFHLTDRHKLLIAASACMLSFGRKNYLYNLIEYILIYPKEFYSKTNDQYHKGEFNPKERVIVFSWKDFEEGYDVANDNLNLGIHEFMHAMQIEAKSSHDGDSGRFEKYFKKIIKYLTNKNEKDRLLKERYFRAYAFTNQYEFIAVLSEYFIESPQEFKDLFPELYNYIKKILNFNFLYY